ncbi:MAG: LamG domain-containing protein [Bryobacteraceae bacterium]|nr:LamG domain-containing protein [Bryobacteraceae bacterium]
MFRRSLLRMVTVVVFSGAAEQVSAATIGYWRFEEGSGSLIADSSGRGNHGALTPAGAAFSPVVPFDVVPADGFPNNWSLELNGADGAAIVPDSPSLRPASGFTAEAMIDGDGWVVLGKQIGNGTRNSYQIELRFGQLRFQLTDTSIRDHFVTASVPSGSGPFNGFHHVAGSWDGSMMRLYVNGAQVGSVPFAGMLGYDANPFLIGADNDRALGGGPACCWFGGRLDEIRLSDQALVPGQFIIDPSPIPEPSAWTLCAGGIAALALAWRRNRRLRSTTLS